MIREAPRERNLVATGQELDLVVSRIDLMSTKMQSSLVVRHTLVRLQGDIVARPDKLSIWETNSVLLDNLFGERLRG